MPAFRREVVSALAPERVESHRSSARTHEVAQPRCESILYEHPEDLIDARYVRKLGGEFVCFEEPWMRL